MRMHGGYLQHPQQPPLDQVVAELEYGCAGTAAAAAAVVEGADAHDCRSHIKHRRRTKELQKFSPAALRQTAEPTLLVAARMPWRERLARLHQSGGSAACRRREAR